MISKAEISSNSFDFVRELTQNSINKWQSRLAIQQMALLKSNFTHIQSSLIIISWAIIKLCNTMFGEFSHIHLDLNHDI